MNAEALFFHMLKGGVGKRARDEIGACIAKVLRGKKEPATADPEVLESLRKTGFCAIPPVFNEQQIANIHAYFRARARIFYNVGPQSDGSMTHSGQRFAEWPQDVISACPEFAVAAHDPNLLRIAEAYLEAPPLITILTAWWSCPSDAPLGGMQYFHHDRDDFRCLKLFVYLTDVTEETGPHQYVEGTHETEALGNRPDEFWRWLDASHRKHEADVAEWFWFPRTITGSAGATFLEDTRGLHRGVPPKTGPRLAFEICYTMLPKLNAAYGPIP